jgi:peptide/nickel transport system ATP-binding protein
MQLVCERGRVREYGADLGRLTEFAEKAGNSMAVLLEVNHLKKYFSTPRGSLHAVDDVSFTIDEGKTIGVVGESGCGKSTLGRTLIHLLESTDGQILYRGEDITRVTKKELGKLRHKMQIIFQDPNSSLDPRKTVESTIREPMKLSKRFKNDEINEKVNELMELVGADRRMRRAYPHELDGGRRQRVGIARALAMDPEFVVCDEPVSALDVSIQAQILNLLQDLQEKKKLTYLFVTHDMSVVRHLSDDICVMYLGQIVEIGPSKELFKSPLHPYTQVLLSAIPSTDLRDEKKRIVTKGEITSPINPKPGCRFASRCAHCRPACEAPQTLDEPAPGHFVNCCRAREINGIAALGQAEVGIH